MSTVKVPHLYTPRGYQLPVLEAMEQGIRRAITVWHRRGGKDLTWLAITTRAMVQRPGAYYHVFPSYAQAKKALWEGQDNEGQRLMARFPEAIVARRNESEMRVEFRPLNGAPAGSSWQLIGVENIDAIRGTNPVGVVFSEYPTMPQGAEAWDTVVKPILLANGGWAGFCYTPRGRNHGWDLYEGALRVDAADQAAGRAPSWFVQTLTIEDTGVITAEQIERERLEGTAEEVIQQEYYCSFAGSLVGAYYAEQLAAAEQGGRVRRVPFDPTLPVHTAWDLGVGDSTAIWFVQTVGREVRLIDFYESSGKDITHYIRVLKEMKPYTYGRHLVPFDAEHKTMTGGTVREQASRMGVRMQVVKKLSIEEGIDAARRLMARCWWDVETCREGLDHLRQYRKEWDRKRQEYKRLPFHDEHSHAADAFRYLAVGLKDWSGDGQPLQRYASSGTTDLLEYDRRAVGERMARSSLARDW